MKSARILAVVQYGNLINKKESMNSALLNVYVRDG